MVAVVEAIIEPLSSLVVVVVRKEWKGNGMEGNTISIPHIGQASPFGQSLSDRDVFRLRLAPVDQILTNGFHTLCGNHDDHFWDQIPMRHAGRCDKQHFFHFTKYQILCYNNMPTMII